MPKIRIGVLRGGPSNEHEVSLETGKQIIEHLPESKYQPLDIFISKEEKWFYQNKELEPVQILTLVDAVFNGLHGYFGEDGKVQIIIEKYIKGREATVAVLENFRKNSYYPLPIIEIIPANSSTKIFDYQSKYDSKTREICPGRFGDKIKGRAFESAVKSHQALGLRHYSRIDMIITPQDEIYVLEANSLPGLTKESLFPKAALSVGLEFPQLLDHLVRLAMK